MHIRKNIDLICLIHLDLNKLCNYNFFVFMESKSQQKKKTQLENQTQIQSYKPSKANKAKSKKIGVFALHKGLWSIVFSFLGLNQELLKLRIVNRKWKKNVEYSIEIMILNRKASLQNQLIIEDDLDESAKTEIEKALSRRKEYENVLPMIPRKYSLFARLSDIARLQKPPTCIQESLISVLNLTITENQYQKLKGIDWKYCQDALKKKNFMDALIQVTPNTLNDNTVRRFEYFRDRSMVTPEYVHRECTAAALMLEWGLSIVECYKEEKNLSTEVRNVLQKMAELRNEQAFIENFSNLFKKMLRS